MEENKIEESFSFRDLFLKSKPRDEVITSDENILFNPFTLADRGLVRFTDVERDFLSVYQETSLNTKNFSYNDFLTTKIYPEIYFVVDKIAKHVASLPIDIYKDKSKNIKVQGLWTSYLLNTNANEGLTSYQFKYRMISNLYYHGVSYAVKINDVNNKDKPQLVVIDNKRLLRYYDNEYNLYYYLYMGVDMSNWYYNLSQNYINENEEIIIRKITNNKDTYIFQESEVIKLTFDETGNSPLNWLWKDLGLLPMVRASIKKSLLEGNNIKAVVYGREAVGGQDGQATSSYQLQKLLRSSQSGAITVDSFTQKIDYVKDSINANNYFDNLTNLKQQISQSLGVPAEILEGSSATNAKVQDALNMFILNLTPLLKNFEESLDVALFSTNFLTSGGGCKFDLSSLKNWDTTTFVNNLQIMANAGFITINEGREMLGLEKHKNKEVGDILLAKIEMANMKNALATQGSSGSSKPTSPTNPNIDPNNQGGGMFGNQNDNTKQNNDKNNQK